MVKARIAKEVTVRAFNEIGVLANLARILADKGINILAVSAWVEGRDALVRLVTDETTRVGETLRAKQYNPQQNEVVLTEAPHKPGMLHRITEKLAAAGIDLHFIYATSATNQDKCVIVFSSSNNERAVVLLNA